MTNPSGRLTTEDLDPWARRWSLVLAPGFAKALLTWPVTTVTAVLVVIGVGFVIIAASATLDLGLDQPNRPDTASAVGPWPTTVLSTVGRAAQVAASVVALAAFAAMSVVFALLIIVTILATSPWCVCWLTGRTGAERNSFAGTRQSSAPRVTSLHMAGEPTCETDHCEDCEGLRHPPGAFHGGCANRLRDEDASPDPAVGRSASLTPLSALSLTDAQLCLAWRRTFPSLLNAPTAADTLRVVDQRRICLDELERRDPRGLAKWLASGPRAAGSPEKHLSHRPTPARASPPSGGEARGHTA